MNTIFILFMVLIMILCILLIIFVMAQNPKGGGLSSTFGGTSSAQFGVQRTNDFMEKATWTLGTIITVFILLSIVLTGNHSTSLNTTPTKKNNPAKAATQSNSAKETTPPVQLPINK